MINKYMLAFSVIFFNEDGNGISGFANWAVTLDRPIWNGESILELTRKFEKESGYPKNSAVLINFQKLEDLT